MDNRLHDGPTHFITGQRNYQPPPKTKPRASLAALQWAADRAGQSYGSFTLNLEPADEERIQAEFEKHKRDREARRTARVENDGAAADEFIITDEDA